MLGPLVILAVGSIVAGYIHIPHFVEPALRVEAGRAGHHVGWMPIVATTVAVLGILLAYYLYLAFPEIPSRIYASARGVARVLENKYGFDSVYDRFASRAVVGGSEDVLWRGVDIRIIDGAVNGTAAAAAALARSVRTAQVGLVRGYALVILGGAVAVLSYLLWPR
jgi:NADH-quinone oxidoreductase subunit L